jgi:hypothetical protein
MAARQQNGDQGDADVTRASGDKNIHDSLVQGSMFKVQCSSPSTPSQDRVLSGQLILSVSRALSCDTRTALFDSKNLRNVQQIWDTQIGSKFNAQSSMFPGIPDL